MLVSHMSFWAETNGGVAKCWQFSQANESNNTVISFNKLFVFSSLTSLNIYCRVAGLSVRLSKLPGIHN